MTDSQRPADIELLFSLAASLNEYASPGLSWDTLPADGSNRPGDDFNRRADWMGDVLGPVGWEVMLRRGEVLYIRRPDKQGKVWSATIGHCKTPDGSPLLHVFTSSAPPFEPEKTYSKFAAYTLLHHSGDYKAAARALAGKGYGEQRQKAATAKPETNGHVPAEPKRERPELDIPEPPPWPEPPCEAVYYGLAGEIVRTIEPQTEADPVAILIQFLTMFGNAAGRKAYWRVENDRHYPNLYICLVGETAKGRKGTAMGRAKQAFQALGDEWLKKCVTSGLSSGEGLIRAVRDPVWSRQAVKRNGQTVESEEVLSDPGIDDKRLLVVEPEFGRVLRVMEREGNTLSSRLREGWDSGNLVNMTKAGERASGAHLSLIAHVTLIELRKLFTDVEAANGLGNRFLWAAVRRSKLLPFGGSPVDLDRVAFLVELAVKEALKEEREVPFSAQAAQLWGDESYTRLTLPRPGLLGAITNRAESQVRRLALIYALLDTTPEVELPHLIAALELWDYCERSCRWAFGDSTGSRLADEALALITGAGEAGVTQTDISNFFGRNKSASEIGEALSVLASAKLARNEKVASGGRPVVRWYSLTPTK